MHSVTIRSALESDAPLFHALATACPPLDVHTPYTYWVLAFMFRDGCFVAVDNDKPVGFVTTVRRDDTAFLWQIGVKETSRGTGVSTMLIDAVCAWARETGVTQLQLSISSDNAASLGSFRSYATRNGLTFSTIGHLDLTVADDPSFSENEDIFQLDLR